MKRRSFLVAATVAGGGFLVGCASSSRQSLRSAKLRLTQGQIALNGWVKVAPDGTVTTMMAKSEMGQGVHTGLMMLVAEEMDCAWSQMRFEYAPIDPLYGNVTAMAEGVPFRADDTSLIASSMRWTMNSMMRQLGFMMTGGSGSMRDLWLPMRQAAAATRAALVEGVAREWKISASDVRVAEGIFTGPGGQSIQLGDVVKLLGDNPRPAEVVTLKSASQFRFIGKPMPRDDSLPKTEGRSTFGIDVRPPEMLHAAVRMAPCCGGTVKSFDGSKARSLPGVLGVVSFDNAHGGTGGVAVVADRWWRASKALDSVDVQFDDGPMGSFSTSVAFEKMSSTLDTEEGFAFWKVGDVKTAIAASSRKLQAEYRAPYLAHATMEPMNCTVLYRLDRATVWVPTQVPDFARRATAKALGLAEDAVDVKVTYLGGGFGRRLEVDFIAQAASVAKQFPGKPVQVLWNREEDMRHDFYRPACVSRFQAGLDEKGRIAAWKNVSAGQAVVAAFLPRNSGMPSMGPDKTASEGAFDVSYEFPTVRVGHATVEMPVPVGFWRGVGHSHQAFFKEGFLDECASAAGADPFRYRQELLARHPRQRAVLELAANRAGWGSPMAPAADGAKKGRGIALHECFGSTVAHVAVVSVGADGTIRVHRVVCAIDCGLAVNPNTISQQMEGAIVFGLSAALNGQIDIERGRVKQGNFHEYQPLRFHECPEIEVHIVPSAEPPEGVGEPGVPPIAPAVANAVFAATGKRLRSLPLSLAA